MLNINNISHVQIVLPIYVFLMPQFDIFSFFSQLFWVLIGFCYLYLILSFYVLPSFAVILKIRSKKLAQVNAIFDSKPVALTLFNSSLFFDSLTGLFYYRSLSESVLSKHMKRFDELTIKNEIVTILKSRFLDAIKMVSKIKIL